MPGYASLEGQLPGLVNLPKIQNFGRLAYSCTANEAMYQVASKIFGALKPENIAIIENLHTNFYNSERTKVSVDVLEESVAFGKAVGDAVLNRANNDGFLTIRNASYTVPSSAINPAYWSATNATVAPLEPYWGKLQCFAMKSGEACNVASTVTFSTEPGSAFYTQALEVANVTKALNAKEKAIAAWWADGASQTSTPPGHWNAIAGQIAHLKHLDLAKTAETYALLNIAMADAFISCWDQKYNINLLRPYTYIRNYIPGNTNWTPYLATPPFPEYPSGHSVASAAAADILTNLFGQVAFTDSSNIHLGLQPHAYSSFREAADEAAISRLYGGIHFREAIENGLKQGREVSKVVTSAIQFRK